jgi:hypothetical protein
MKRLLAVALVGAAALAVPGLAAAKELTKAEVCGVEDCTTVTGAALMRLANAGDGSTESASPPGPYYRVTLTTKHEGQSESWSIFYVPGDRLALPEGQWEQIGGAALAEYKSATAGLRPFPTPELVRVTIDGRVMKDPASYAALYTAGSKDGVSFSGLADWVPVETRFRGDTPWSGEPYLFFSPRNGTLQRGIEVVRLPEGMAADVRAGRSLRADDGFPWALAAVIALAALLAASGTLWLARRREPAAKARRTPLAT